ncbi:MAG: molybdopterin-dependent oxidoreductase, partial [Nitriliruptoraceae bacterium]
PGASLAMSILTLVGATLVTLAVLRALVLRLTPTPTTVTAGRSDIAAIDRRGFVCGALAAAVSGLAAATIGRLTAASSTSTGTEDAEVTLPEPASTLPPVEGDLAGEVPGVSPVLTPVDDFFRIDTAISLPRVDPVDWRLRIHGLVERELELTLDDLLARELVEVDATISCVSNEVGGDLVGTARWLGVHLAELLDEAGPTPDAEQLVGRSVDDWTAGFPLEVARDGRDAIVAVAMNDEQLPRRHGFPARLVVPGLYGYVSATKWLAEIELTTWDGFDGYWVPLGWSKRAPVKTTSRIDVPADGAEVDGDQVVAAGVAWAPVRGIQRVAVRVDEGEWIDAQLAPALSDATWVQWHLILELPSGEHRLAVRAVDGDGQVQPEGPAPPSPNGAEGWHTVSVRVA